jgi:twitching motility protein PilT
MIQKVDLMGVLRLAVDENASDIHFKVGVPPYLRVFGELQAVDTEVLDADSMKEVICSILGDDAKEKLTRGDADRSFVLNDETNLTNKRRFRVHGGKDDIGYTLDMRLIPDEILSVEKVGFPFPGIWQDIIELKQGLVLITGPTDSGKTTTLASLIQRINEEKAAHIITIEDPIEYAFRSIKSLISQREVGRDVASFELGLEAAMRQRPDVILVGEIRNKETAYTALNAAGTGHLVFSTMHTNGAVETVSQYVNKFDASEQETIRSELASRLCYVLSQRLVPYTENRGTKRSLAMEVLNVRHASGVKAHISKGQDDQLLSDMQIGHKYAMIDMNSQLLQLYNNGDITAEIALEYSSRPLDMKTILEKRNK